MTRYRSERGERWDGFEHRAGDIVVSTRSKSGTTWLQMVCCLLIHQRAELPAPLGQLAPWLDWDAEPLDDVRARLAAQPHRRVIKTHLPLDGLPLDPSVTYVVVVRHPLDVAVSFFHHLRNLDPARRAQPSAGTSPIADLAAGPLEAWLDHWVDDRTDPLDSLDTLPGNLHHFGDAWGRRRDPNVVLLHYEDLVVDLDGEMRRMAGRLGIQVPEERWSRLVAAAGFEAMRERSREVSPDHLGVFKDRRAFFRSGAVGEGRAACSDAQLRRYGRRVAELAAPDALGWLHREQSARW